MTKERSFFTGTFREKAQDYFVQVSLILLSLFIAVGADRCKVANRQAKTLKEYYEAIAKDLTYELDINEKNLFDCESDIAALQRAQGLFRYDEADSLRAGLQSVAEVATRGVFRTFDPTTFDVMLSTGDVVLIKDLELRNDLSDVFSFREKILQQDLQEYDEQLKKSLEDLGEFIDFSCLVQSRTLVECVQNQSAFVQDPHNELMLLQFQANSRAFHLGIAIRNNKQMIGVLDSLLQR